MASPFIIKNVFNQSAVTIGNCSLFVGLAIMAGGLISKRFIKKSLTFKLHVAVSSLITLSLLMAVLMHYHPHIIAMMVIIVFFHIAGGFTFNTVYTYALGRFSSNAGVVSGIVGGGTFVLASIMSYGIVSLLEVNSPASLGIAYLICAVLTGLAVIVFEALQRFTKNKQLEAQPVI